MNKIKLAGALLAVLVSGWVGYKLAPVPAAEIKTITLDRIVTQDRVITKDVVRTETRPDGTKIVTVEKTDAKEHVGETTKSRQVQSSGTVKVQSKYSLGLSYRPSLSDFSFKGDYGVELGRRVLNSPLWVNVAFNTKKELTVGIKVEF